MTNVILFVGPVRINKYLKDLKLNFYHQVKYDSNVVRYLPYSYQQVVFTQLASGAWADIVIKFSRLFETVALFVSEQGLDAILKTLPTEVLLTLAGLKILKERFGANRMEWNLVAGKAVGYIRHRLGVLPIPIDQMIARLQFPFYLE